MVEKLLVVGAGGFLGAIARYGLSSLTHRSISAQFLTGTLGGESYRLFAYRGVDGHGGQASIFFAQYEALFDNWPSGFMHDLFRSRIRNIRAFSRARIFLGVIECQRKYNPGTGRCGRGLDGCQIRQRLVAIFYQSAFFSNRHITII